MINTLIIKYTAPLWCNPIIWLVLIAVSCMYIWGKVSNYLASWNEAKKVFWLKIGMGVMLLLAFIIIYGVGYAWCSDFSLWGWGGE